MKKKLVSMFLLCGVLMGSFVGCTGDKNAQSTEQSSQVETESETQTEFEVERETEFVEENEENSQKVEADIEGNADSPEIEFMWNSEMENLTKEEIVDRMMYAISHQTVSLQSRGAGDVEEIDNYFAVTTAVFHSEYYEAFYSEYPDPEMNYAMRVDDKILKQSMKDLFGKEYSVEEYINRGIFDNAIREKDGTLYYGIGDWGLSYPDFKLETLKGTSVTGKIVWVEEELGTEELVAYVNATIVENSDSQYGYVIESLTIDFVE